MSDQSKEMRRSPITTTNAGAPAPSDETSLTVGPNGPIVLQDAYLLEKLAHFVRERVPNRVYHVKGGGAFGYFEVTTDVTQWTKAAFLNKVGKRTPIFARFSEVAAEELRWLRPPYPMPYAIFGDSAGCFMDFCVQIG